MKSLRGILTRSILFATILLCAAAGAALYFSMREALLEQFDSGLSAKVRAIASTLRIDHSGHYEMDFADESMQEFSPGRHAEYFHVIGPDGKTFQLSESLGGKELISAAAAPSDRHAWDMTLPDGRRGRAMSISIVPASEDEDRDQHPATRAAKSSAAPFLVVVARGRGNVDEVLAKLLTAMIFTAAVLALAVIVAVRAAIGRGLRPVNALAQQAAAIGPETLEYRFDVTSLPAELQPICLRLNDLLERLDTAFKRERRLNADIAHELRTPIAELRSLTEVARRWPGDEKQTTQYFHDAHDVALRMESLVETLLALARSQTRKGSIRSERIELRALVDHAIEPLREDIGQRRLELAVSIEPGFAVQSDRLMFRRIVENLISNAVQYTPIAGQIRCTAARKSDRAMLIIGNTNDSLQRGDLAAMFEPFWRKDAARSGDSHAGLGLALVGEYARQLRISVTPKLIDESWFEIAIEMSGCGEPSAVECADGRDLTKLLARDGVERPADITGIDSKK